MKRIGIFFLTLCLVCSLLLGCGGGNNPTTVEPSISADAAFHIRFIDVGQADAALVECEGHYMLIDGGNRDDSNLIYTVLKNERIEHLDIVVGTHAHEDHIGGLPGAFHYATAATTLCPVTDYNSEAFSDFRRMAKSRGGGITVPSVGDTYSLGSALIEILGVNSTPDTNNTSIVLMITYGEVKFLFTGDAEREAEQIILASGADLEATLLKVGHHGSDSSTTYPFLREIMPKYAVISVGTGNTYGHPTENTLSRLRDADVTVYRTDLQGDILVSCDGKHLSISTGEKTVAVQPTTDYILNESTHKFHLPNCSTVARMSEENKRLINTTREALISTGYTPCGVCNP